MGAQKSFLHLCGAKVGARTKLAEQIYLPDTLEIGNDCFFASGNVLTSLRLDLGVVSVVSKTQIGDSCFAGNGNHVNEGLPARTHLGLHTLLSKKPESAGGFFGNPPMRFP